MQDPEDAWDGSDPAMASLLHESKARDEDRADRKNPAILLLAAIVLMIAFATVVVTVVPIASSSTMSVAVMQNDDLWIEQTPSTLNFTLRRQNYDPLDYFDKSIANPISNYVFLGAHSAIIEPLASMQLHVYGEEGDFQFTVCPAEGTEEQCQVGRNSTVSFACSPHEVLSVQVDQILTNGTALVRARGSVLCLYVRREVRALRREDRDRFLDASRLLSEVSEEEGQGRYGSDYHSSSYLAKFHFFNAAWQDADHYHEGNGFLTQHIKITNLFEKALQSVDPLVSVPYWDFTIDTSEGRNALDAFVVGPDWYGGVQLPPNGAGFTYEDSVLDARIEGGRWNNITAEMNTEYPDLQSGYGFLRSPWNLNPSPYVSRCTLLRGRPEGQTAFPSCESHYDLLQMNDMMDFFYDMQLLPHGAVHIELGGAFGCEVLEPLLQSGHILDEESLWGVCRKWFIILKEGYRANYFVPQSDCQVAPAVTDSRCGLIGTDAGRGLYYALFQRVMGKNIDLTKVDSEQVWFDFIVANGSMIFTGDHLESASTGDPSFWVIHGTLERLLQVKLMTGGFAHEVWPTTVGQGFVCNKAQCYDAATDTKGFHADCCYGHYEHDQMFDAVSGSRDVKVGPTNREVLDGTDPRRADYSMGYAYDTFSWPHCDQDFSAMLRGLRASYGAVTADTEHQTSVKKKKSDHLENGGP
mmetsp:Transcript_19557/g.43588  ORF Transcript_19557/g.43588 Transcript_19557/m.43588 type:complete len:695 (-) Transcript_19557:276-2360(-)|eukprot:CAMPEP_0173227606 /NCGR_PEP_ID=MMETSP1142-20121109/6056_1 /TAXON_ID=483371 /ORGANISM="non described non described, Strain CCMP2298" /LENGTH=694 /DNA_ID=CAMNT_0014156139 /DNA_START=128 /DNA_END=2212 /DNA_ORIENTATION=+